MQGNNRDTFESYLKEKFSGLFCKLKGYSETGRSLYGNSWISDLQNQNHFEKFFKNIVSWAHLRGSNVVVQK